MAPDPIFIFFMQYIKIELLFVASEIDLWQMCLEFGYAFLFFRVFFDKHAFIYLLLNNVSHLVCVFYVLGTSDTELIYPRN